MEMQPERFTNIRLFATRDITARKLTDRQADAAMQADAALQFLQPQGLRSKWAGIEAPLSTNWP